MSRGTLEITSPTEAELEDIDSLIVEMRRTDQEALEHDPDFEKWLEKVAAKVD